MRIGNRNAVDYLSLAGFWNPPKPFRNDEFYNNISYDNSQYDVFTFYHEYPESHNTWDWSDQGDPWYVTTDTVTVTDDDFISLDLSQLRGARKADNSLPDVTTFHLVQGSDLIDMGTSPVKDVGVISYYGTAPDIGAFESNYEARTEKPLTGTGSKVMISNGVILHNNE